MYKVLSDTKGNLICILRDDGLSIPKNFDNSDYQTYLKWVSEGNTPADEVTE
jgi:hypothetical protein